MHLTGKTEINPSLLLGGSGEYKFFSTLMELGYAVYTPLVDAAGVDCVATKNHLTFLQFQVKSSTEGKNYALIKVKRRPNYFFVFYCVSTNSTWLIPSEDFVRIAKPDTPDKKTGEKTYRISLTRSKDKKAYPDPDYDAYLGENGLRLIP